MKQTRRIISVLLLIAVSAAALAACGGDAGTAAAPASTAAQGGGDAAAETAAETEPDIADSLRDADYGGSDFHILLEATEYCPMFYTCELTGDVVDDAVYNRTQYVNEKYNVNIVYTCNPDNWYFSTEFKNMLFAGEGLYDLASGVSLYLMPAALQGFYLDLKNNDIIQFDQPWYLHHLNDSIELGGKMLAVSGFYDMPTLSRVHCTYFSSKLAEAFGVEDLYQIVRDGKWTFEKMISLAEPVSADLDGDGVWNQETDRYGITSQWDVLDIAYSGTGFSFLSTDGDGNISLTPITQNEVNANELLYDLQKNHKELYYSGYDKGGSHKYDEMIQVFTQDRALFLINTIAYASDARLREMGTYGILPVPKYRDDQAEYGAFTSMFLSALPTTCKDPEKSATILDALNCFSYRDVYPAYFTIALSQKFMNDDDSREMLDIVYKNTHCDTTYIYAEHFGTDLALSIGLQKDYMSWYEKNVKKHNKAIDKMTALLAEIPE
ncbi:MAG: hypothetical protein K6D94_02185 [Clostridiales bacterium]|nr:hypothetical protein [Clostridiales bacterium]